MIKYKITTISEPDKILVRESVHDMNNFINMIRSYDGITINEVFYTFHNIAKIELYTRETTILCE